MRNPEKKNPQKRNPNWHRDEIILALDLYFSPDRGSIDKKNPKVIELSKVLNSLPLFVNRPDKERFRNPNGVGTKLANFLPFDEGYKGKGLKHGSKLDEILYREYEGQQDLLHSVAQQIRQVIKDEVLRAKILMIEDDEQTMEDSVFEGQVIYKLHKVRERDQTIVKKKKTQVMERHGNLACEACDFVFQECYGLLGKDFVECHHLTPLAQLDVERKTSLNDLALVCSNCHRMLHRRIDGLSIADLKLLIQYGGEL